MTIIKKIIALSFSLLIALNVNASTWSSNLTRGIREFFWASAENKYFQPSQKYTPEKISEAKRYSEPLLNPLIPAQIGRARQDQAQGEQADAQAGQADAEEGQAEDREEQQVAPITGEVVAQRTAFLINRMLPLGLVNPMLTNDEMEAHNQRVDAAQARPTTFANFSRLICRTVAPIATVGFGAYLFRETVAAHCKEAILLGTSVAVLSQLGMNCVCEYTGVSNYKKALSVSALVAAGAAGLRYFR